MKNWILLVGIAGVIGAAAGAAIPSVTAVIAKAHTGAGSPPAISHSSHIGASRPHTPLIRAKYNEQHAADNKRAEDAKTREAEASHAILAAQDYFLTGDQNGHAEWRSANDATAHCGVTLEGRYIVVRNAIGETRYDEPQSGSKAGFIRMWERVDCQTTAPVHQAALLERQAAERYYDATHPVDPDCLIRRIKRMSLGPSEVRRQLAHPHQCQQPRSVWEADMPDPGDPATADQANSSR